MSVNAIGCAAGSAVPDAVIPDGELEVLADPGGAPSAEEALAIDLAPTWRANLGKPASGPPAVSRHVVAVMGVDRYLTVVRRSTGQALWRRRLNATGTTGAFLADNRVYAGTGGRQGRVYALDARDGSRAWTRQVGPVSNPIGVTTDRVVVATERGIVSALDPASGAVRWSTRMHRPIRSGVTLMDDGVLVATDDSLFLLSHRDGEPVRRAAIAGTLIAPPVLIDTLIIVASPDAVVAAYARDDFRELWIAEVDEPIFGSAAVARDTVFAVTLHGRLWAIPLANPAARRSIDLAAPVRAAPAPVADGVLVGTVRGEVLFAAWDGRPPARRVRVDGPIEQQPIVSDGTLMVLDGRGVMHAWK